MLACRIVSDEHAWPAPWTEAAAHDGALRAVAAEVGARGDVAAASAVHRTLRLAARVTGAPLALVSLASPDGVRSWRSDGVTPPLEPEGVGLADEVARRGEALIVPDLAASGRFAGHPWLAGDAAIGAFAGVPVTLSDGCVVGVVAVADRVAGELPDADGVDALRDVATALADGIERVDVEDALRQSRADVRRAVATDALTGLPNRRTLHDRLDAALALARRTGHGVALAVVEVRGLAEVRTRHGVWVADTLLTQVAAALETAARDHDLIARVGDDTFACVWQAVSENGAMVAAQRAARHVAGSYAAVDTVAPGSLELELEADVGVAVFPRDAEDAVGLLRAAAVAVERAKRDGGGVLRYDARD